ncbi:MAG: YDG domain-containing protein [Oscillospiraceae bacterium]|nr:YDG domain-containing protein [Oscillospiraceae bacterium]
MNKKTFTKTIAWAVTFALALAIIPAMPFSVQAVTAVGNYADLQSAAASGGTDDITLSANIDGATQLTIERSLTLDLNGHTLKIEIPDSVGQSSNGIKIETGVTLTIKDDSVGETGELEVINRASEEPTYSNGAAINTNGGTLIIESGKINATGGNMGAGIGGGTQVSGGSVTINGGKVTATGGNRGAGIGGGRYGNGGTVTINDGNVTADGGQYGTGIGGGNAGNGGTITINGGTIRGTGGDYAAGIGGGRSNGVDTGGGGTINITGGNITATAGTDTASAIGAGFGGTDGTVTVEGVYDYWTNTTNTAPTEMTGSGAFTWSDTYGYIRLEAHEIFVNNVKVQDPTVSAIESAITAALAGNDEVTVTGKFTSADSKLTLNIESGKKVIWNAHYSGTMTAYTDELTYISGAGEMEIAEDGYIEATRGMAVAIGNTITLTINGGTVTIPDTSESRAIVAYADSTVVVNGGNVRSITAQARSVLTINDGTIDIVRAASSSTIYVTGGAIDNGRIVIQLDGTQTAYYIGNNGAKFRTDGTNTAFTPDTNLFQLDAAPTLTNDDDTAHNPNDDPYQGKVTATFPAGLVVGTITVNGLTAGQYTVNADKTVTFAGTYDDDDITLTVTGTLAGGRIPVTFTTAAFGVNVDTPLIATTVTVTPPDGITYGETLGNPTAEADEGGDTFTYTYEGESLNSKIYLVSPTKPTEPGTYRVIATLVSGTHQGSGTSANFTISPKQLTWDADGTVSNRGFISGSTAATIATAPTLDGVIGGDTVTVKNGTVNFASSNVGTHTVTATGFGIEGTDSWKYTISGQPPFEDGEIEPSYFIAEKGTHYTTTVLNNGWTNGDFVITAMSSFDKDYEISKDGKTWSDKITYSDETADGSATFYVREWVRDVDTGDISAQATEAYKIDKTAPTAQVQYNTDGFKAFSSTMQFFKDGVAVTFQGADSLSGVAKVEYYHASALITDFSAVAWQTYTTPRSILTREKRFQYIQVTDVAGNVSQVYYDRVLVFNDSAATASGEYTFGSDVDLAVPVAMNGNTVKSITGNGITTADYTAGTNSITFDKEFLAGLNYGADHAPKDYTFTVTWNPMGETAPDGTASNTTITITVKSPCESSHDFQNYAPNNDATCEVDGTETGTCTRCGEEGGTRTVTGSALGHTWATNANGTHNCTRAGCGVENIPCSPTGTQGDICTDCGYIEPDPDCDHDNVTEIQDPAPTCTTGGASVTVCDDCGGTVGADTLGALDHDFRDYVYNDNATCTADGTETSDCSRCTEATDTRTVEDSKLPHTPGAAATCTTAQTCTVCTTVLTAALDHDFQDYEPDNNATCTAHGTETATCIRCDETNSRMEIDSMLPHTPKTENCTECSVCTTTGLSRTCSTENPCTFHTPDPDEPGPEPDDSDNGGGSNNPINSGRRPTSTTNTTTTTTASNENESVTGTEEIIIDVPVTVIQEIAGNLPTTQIAATSAGSQLITTTTANAGQNAVLLVYNDDTGEFEVVSAATVNADGTATVNIPGAGDYIVVVAQTGDLTGTGNVTAADALLLLQALTGNAELNPLQKFLTSSRSDSKYTATDALNILKFVAGMIDEL